MPEAESLEAINKFPGWDAPYVNLFLGIGEKGVRGI
jgi:hypothetical protein